VALGGPNIYPGVLSWLGVGRELTAGTSVLPAFTQPLDQGSFEPEDTPKFLQDKAIRGAMTDLFYETLGVESATFSFGGPNFLDTHGYFFDNVFGDLSTTCSSVSTSGTISGTVPVGAISMTLSSAPPAGWTAGAYIQLGTALTANTPASYVNEVLLISGTASGSVVNFANTPTRFAHPSLIPLNGGNTVLTVGSSIGNLCVGTVFTHRFAALNSALGYGGAFGAQPPTHTFTDVTNIVNVFTSPTFGNAPSNPFGARAYPFACLKNIDFSGNAEQLLGIKMAGDSFISTPATGAPVLNVTGSRPVPNWNSTVTTLGYTIASGAGNPYNGIGEFSISFKRQTQVYWTVQGTQQPFVIARGPLTMDGTIQWDPTNSEAPLDIMLLNAQGPMSIVVTNAGIANAGTPFTLTFNASQVANIKSKIMRSKALIGYGNSFEGVGNANDIGGSGGLGPGTVTLVNNIPTY
jgi:hypothetical protein